MEALDLIDCLHRFRNNSVIFMGVRSDSTKICPLAGQHATTQKEVWRGVIRLVWIKSINCGGSIWELDLIISERSPI